MATSEDLHLATREDFLMATDNRRHSSLGMLSPIAHERALSAETEKEAA
ncbi:MAG TPA: hypothetical protein VK053_17770 [Jiangellaceae bacterium]|nr:hypothetical protein [Jiangellaceae bacterium]